jgi:hypothetical protein
LRFAIMTRPPLARPQSGAQLVNGKSLQSDRSATTGVRRSLPPAKEASYGDVMQTRKNMLDDRLGHGCLPFRRRFGLRP